MYRRMVVVVCVILVLIAIWFFVYRDREANVYITGIYMFGGIPPEEPVIRLVEDNDEKMNIHLFERDAKFSDVYIEDGLVYAEFLCSQPIRLTASFFSTDLEVTPDDCPELLTGVRVMMVSSPAVMFEMTCRDCQSMIYSSITTPEEGVALEIGDLYIERIKEDTAAIVLSPKSRN